MTINSISIRTFCVPIVASFIAFLPLISHACERTAQTEYMSASNEMQTLDRSVHHFLKSLSTQQGIELLILAYDAPDYIEHYRQRLVTLAVNQDNLTDRLTDFYLCSGLKQEEIDVKFGDIFKQHDQLLQHLEGHNTAFAESPFTDEIQAYHEQAVNLFGDTESGVLQPLQLTQNIYQNITAKFAQRATIYDLWKLKEAKGTDEFMRVTGLNIMKYSPAAQLQQHLDRGLSKDSFVMFGGPSDGEEYPHSIHYLARELSGYTGDGNLPTAEEIPNRSKLAILVETSESNKRELLKLLTQYEDAATQFKKRSAQRYNIQSWQQSDRQATNMGELMQIWAIHNEQKIREQADVIDELLNPKVAID